MTSTTKMTAIACAMAAFIPMAALAQISGNPGYLFDGSAQVVKTAAGECWRTGEWTPALATEPCDPSLRRAAASPAVPPKEQVAQAEAAPAPMVAPVPVPVRDVAAGVWYDLPLPP